MDYIIQYRKGNENVVADALSRTKEIGNCQAIIAVVPDWVKDISASYEMTGWAKNLLAQLAIQPASKPGYTLSTGLIKFKGRLVVGNNEPDKRTRSCSPYTTLLWGDI